MKMIRVTIGREYVNDNLIFTCTIFSVGIRIAQLVQQIAIVRTVRVLKPTGGRDLPVKTGAEAHPAISAVGIGGLYQR
jgi:hypothetical protein